MPNKIKTFEDCEENARHFFNVLSNQESIAYATLSKFFHWYYFPKYDNFAPSKFIGYKNTTITSYKGSGKGNETEDALKKLFNQLKRDQNKALYDLFRKKLESKYFTDNGKTPSARLTGGTGAFHYPKGYDPLILLAPEISYPEELDDSSLAKIFEGSVKEIKINRYERNPAARAASIQHHGAICKVCDFDFEKTYGDIGKGYIHVHHIVPLSQIRKEYEINTKDDLIPVCPNCHAMLHKNKEPFSVSELRSIIDKQKTIS